MNEAMYWANVAHPTMTPPTWAKSTDRRPFTARSTIGSSRRRSQRTHHAIITIEVPTRTTTGPDAQPHLDALVMPRSSTVERGGEHDRSGHVEAGGEPANRTSGRDADEHEGDQEQRASEPEGRPPPVAADDGAHEDGAEAGAETGAGRRDDGDPAPDVPAGQLVADDPVRQRDHSGSEALDGASGDDDRQRAGGRRDDAPTDGHRRGSRAGAAACRTCPPSAR